MRRSFFSLLLPLLFVAIALFLHRGLAQESEEGKEDGIHVQQKPSLEEALLQTYRSGNSYDSTKEDFRCRACVAAADLFFHDILPPAQARYSDYIASVSRDTTGSRSSTADRAARMAGRTRAREQMVVEVHESIDNLCKELKKRHPSGEPAIKDRKNEWVVRSNQPLGGSQKDLWEGIGIACPAVLEDLNEEFAEIAFRLLMPERFSHLPPSSEEREEGPANQPQHEAGTKVGHSSSGSSSANRYRLPKAGAFCESASFCSPYVHYHITSEAAVRDLRKAGEKESKLKAMKGAPARAAQDVAARWRNAQRTSGTTTSTRKAETEEPVWRVVLKKEAWVELYNSFPWREMATTDFWRRYFARPLSNPSVTMHFMAMTPVVVGVTMGVAVLVAVIMIPLYFCLWREGEASSRPAKTAPSKKEEKAEPELIRKKQA